MRQCTPRRSGRRQLRFRLYNAAVEFARAEGNAMTARDPQRQAALGAELVEVGETAEGYVEALVSQGVDCLFLNPGTDTFPIQEALQKLAALGKPVPRTILCLFEVVALAAAHGYYAATGR